MASKCTISHLNFTPEKKFSEENPRNSLGVGNILSMDTLPATATPYPRLELYVTGYALIFSRVCPQKTGLSLTLGNFFGV